MDEQNTPREAFLESQEILSTIEWVDAFQNHAEALNAIALFDHQVNMLLEALRAITAKRFSRFLRDAVLAIVRPVRAIHRVREFITADPTTEIAKSVEQDNRIFDRFEDRIVQAVCRLFSIVVERWDGHERFEINLDPSLENELNNQHYLLVYLILLLLEHWVAPENMEASSTYFEISNPKYNRLPGLRRYPPQPQSPSTIEKITTTRQHMKTMMASADENDDAYDEEALIEDNYPLSETGITTLTSGMIHAMLDPRHLESQFVLPLTLSKEWMFMTAGGLASGFLTADESQLGLADKALQVLLYTIDRVPLDGFEMSALDYCSLDSSADRMGLFQVFQVIVNFASTSPSAHHRFYAFQGLDRLIQGCKDDVKLSLLDQLVSPSCPYESMRAAAINLVKATVERSFQKLDQSRVEVTEHLECIGTMAGSEAKSIPKVEQSPFTGPLLLKTFQQSIFRVDTKAFQHSPLKNEGAWLDKYDTFMHAINFYMFLLLRDARTDNLTEVWSASNLVETRQEFLDPLMQRITEMRQDYTVRLARAQAQESTAGTMDVEPPRHKANAKNGVVNFDIDMEDMEDEEEEEEEGDEGGQVPKDTVSDLNGRMVKNELMELLLEQIFALTKVQEEKNTGSGSDSGSDSDSDNEDWKPVK
ncbi:hypothetical protein BGW38_001132 [Lunasporangiospora selenospora]|uniref:Uncharacterized protein n=1 Tax=Lunasporangiospora selenospora TaxID=979761 RepID=A0A9P6KEB2_9FUNG|nr:hypothetical protein BGW38_001132 [Lunasporangiospora selenospora]